VKRKELTGILLCFFLLLFVAVAWAAPIPDDNTCFWLNEYDENRWELAEQPLVVDPKNREASGTFYQSVYVMSEVPVSGWTGNLVTCTAGQNASDFKNAVLQRLNYFRAMAGVPAGITFSDVYTAKAQEAALMMSANYSLSHSPPATWTCYSAVGAEAAGRSNLCLGAYGWSAITAYIEDSGANNAATGHRRWILYPQTQFMGSGDIPETQYRTANALWVFDSNMSSARPDTRDEFVAWPPSGYVPYQVVFPRWSLSYPKAVFTSATITMTSNGNSVPVKRETVHDGYGENTIVWIPKNMNDSDVWQKPVADETYLVSIQNAIVNGVQKSFEYTVTVFDPGVGVPVLSVTPTSRNIAKDAGTTAFSVSNTGTGTMQWTAAVTSGSWLMISSGISGTDTGTITCSFTANTMMSARTATIRVTSTDATGSPKDVTVTQAGAPTPTLLWAETTGRASIWALDANANKTSEILYGPYADWTAKSYHKNSDGTANMLWGRIDGYVSLWMMDAGGNPTSMSYYGPYEGWTARCYHKNSNGTANMLWGRIDGYVSLWSMDVSGTPTSMSYYGPYPGWTAKTYHRNSDGTANMLWVRTGGYVALWMMDEGGNPTSMSYYGPYEGWTAKSYYRNSDGTANMLWAENTGRASIWMMDTSGNKTSEMLYGPYEGWTAQDYD
jgi:hypothetical protein